MAIQRCRVPTVVLALLASVTWPSLGADVFVALDSPAPTLPYTNWMTAAHTIQDAVDAAEDGDTVWVAAGVYATGGRAGYPAGSPLTNRVAIYKPITVCAVSANAAETIIQGAGPPGDSAMRGVFMVEGATLIGFTITNGATLTWGYDAFDRSGGGAWCEPGGTILNCILVGNSAYHGGGAYGGTLSYSQLKDNSAVYGGGAYASLLNNCVLTGNRNDDGAGGGSYLSVLNNCTLSGNAAERGGGASRSTLNNCMLVGNIAEEYGGGSYGGTLNNCTLVRNVAGESGGGSFADAATNCILYYNAAPDGANWSSSTLAYCCTTPDPGGTANITNAPLIASASNPRLLAGSPCIDAGNNAAASGTDIDGQPRIAGGTVDIGCYEYTPPCTGALSVAIHALTTNATRASDIHFEAEVTGIPEVLVWQWGDGQQTTNLFHASHAYLDAGTYDVVLTVSNASGAATCMISVQIADAPVTWYVSTNGNDSAAGTNWATAKLTIQGGIDASRTGDTVLVSDGVYSTGGRVVFGSLTNRIAITKPVTVQSVNGSAVTAIHGAWHPAATNGGAAVRCAWIGNGALLAGFTLRNGATRTSGDSEHERSGGGAWCEEGGAISHCTVEGNSAHDYGGGVYQGTLNNCIVTNNSARMGGGVFWSTLNNCVLSGNSADFGGGACYGALNNCTVVDNSAGFGGGTHGATLSNCIVYYNRARNGANWYLGALQYCCTQPAPGGLGNITNAPAFVSADNSRLAWGSPCIDAGNNAYVKGETDLDGLPRVVSGIVDMGAYEYPWAGPTVYVCTNGNDAATGRSWAEAKLTIQAGADAVADGGTVWVSNGVYAVGGRAVHGTLTNRVAITRPIIVQSVNGPSVTTIMGQGPIGDTAVRCAYVVDGAILAGFTLTNGATRAGYDASRLGGGAYCEPGGVLSNCTISGNSAYIGGGVSGGTLFSCTLTGNTAEYGGGGTRYASLSFCTLLANAAGYAGGGAWGGTLSNCTLADNRAGSYGGGVSGLSVLNNCILTGNRARIGGGADVSTLINCTLTGNSADRGGGAFWSTLNNCTIVGNSAGRGGGADSSTLNNCIVFYNTGNGANWDSSFLPARLSYCCTVPDPGGTGNITNEPMFVANDNLRLAAGSPCINRGDNAFVVGTVDLDGVPRIVGPAVDMGAYEYPLTPSGIPGVWLRDHGMPTDGTADLVDTDGDGMNNRGEYEADTDPTDPASLLRFLAIGEKWGGTRLDWTGGRDAWQFLEVRDALTNGGETWTAIFGIPPPTPLTNAVIDLGATNRVLFYRIRAER